MLPGSDKLQQDADHRAVHHVQEWHIGGEPQQAGDARAVGALRQADAAQPRQPGTQCRC